MDKEEWLKRRSRKNVERIASPIDVEVEDRRDPDAKTTRCVIKDEKVEGCYDDICVAVSIMNVTKVSHSNPILFHSVTLKGCYWCRRDCKGDEVCRAK